MEIKINNKHIKELIKRYPLLSEASSDIINAFDVLFNSYQNGGKLLVAGNGGSAADAEHIVGELMKRFVIPRPISPELSCKLKEIDYERGTYLANNLEEGLMAIPLVSHTALSTAYLNDVDGNGIFAQQLLGYGREGDVFLGISTSGNSENVILSAIVAKAIGMKVIGLTGESGGKLATYSDVCIKAPHTETFLIQELHLPIYHCLCLMLEEAFYGKK